VCSATASRPVEAPAATLAVADAGDRRERRFSGRLDAYSIAAVWHDALAALAAAPERAIVIDASGVDYCDGAGIAMLIDLLRQPRAAKAPTSISGLRPEFQALLDQFDPATMRVPVVPHVMRINVIAEIGPAPEITGLYIREHDEYDA
jgi:anti-anti-sigma factor